MSNGGSDRKSSRPISTRVKYHQGQWQCQKEGGEEGLRFHHGNREDKGDNEEGESKGYRTNQQDERD